MCCLRMSHRGRHKPVHPDDRTQIGAGGDGGQVFDSKPYGTLIWGIKLFGLPPALAAKHDAWAPLGVVQGPTEPGDFGSIFGSLNDFFCQHDPGASVCTLWCTYSVSLTRLRHAPPTSYALVVCQANQEPLPYRSPSRRTLASPRLAAEQSRSGPYWLPWRETSHSWRRSPTASVTVRSMLASGALSPESGILKPRPFGPPP